MNVCSKCGHEYLTEECLRCKKNPYNYFILYIVVVVGSVVLLLFLNMNNNPLIGKWKSINEVVFLGKETIIFTKKEISTMGLIEKVKYRIGENEVVVVDELGVQTVYKIIDKNTISSNIFNIKTTYKRIN